jgi:small subunit ribosomal protein S5
MENTENMEKKKEEFVDEYAEKPEEVLDKSELAELEEMKVESEKDKKNSRRYQRDDENSLESWDPKTKLGKEVKDKKIKDINEILKNNRKILEPEIVDSLLDIKTDLILIGQAKGKFGGGKRRAWRQTQRKTKEGNVLKFSAMAVAGDGKGHVGVGEGNAIETLPARDKAIRKSKLNIFKIVRSCSAFDCDCSDKHTVPFEVNGKSGSVKIKLIPAPQGTGLVVANEIKKILKLAGIEDVYSKTFGKTKTTFNLAKACIDALKKTNARVKN